MIALAVAVRAALDDPDDSVRADGRIEVLCAPEFADACAALGSEVTVTVQSPAETVIALAGGDVGDGVDGWFTSNAWLEVARSRAPDGLDDGRPVASTATVTLADDDRAVAVGALCDSRSLWRCLGDDAGQAWGSLGGVAGWGALKTGVPDADTATGLGVLAAVAAGYFGATDFATNDFDDGGFRSWLPQLVGPRSSVVENPLSILATRPGAYSAAGGTVAQARALAAGVIALDAAPVLTVQAVLVQFDGRDQLPPTGPAVDALRAAGWDEPVVDLPRLLKPGVLAALHTLWTEVIR